LIKSQVISISKISYRKDKRKQNKNPSLKTQKLR